MHDAPQPCKSDWEGRYRAGDAPWDLGRAAPALEALVASLDGVPRRVFVPGAGRGHDAFAWARAGHAVTACDIAPTAVAQGRALAGGGGVDVTWLLGDLFDLPASLRGAFDVVWEQTCYCALAPERRAAYVDAVADVLVPGGSLHAILWNHGAEGGPPFDVTRADAVATFGRRFEIDTLVDVPPWTEARWSEFLLTARRR